MIKKERLFHDYLIQKWHYIHSSPSTNDLLAKSVSKSSPNANIVLYTYKQHSGKGQIGRKWYSGEDVNLTLSLLFHIKGLSANAQFALNMIYSLAILDALRSELDKPLKIKWPNDIYYGDKKLGGILIQNTLRDGKIFKSIIGLGINVNEEDFPQDLPNPISMKQIANKNFVLKKLFASLISHLEVNLKNYDAMEYQALHDSYENNLYQRDKEQKFRLNDGEEQVGRIKGVNKTGLIQIQFGDKMQEFAFREIAYLHD